MDVQFSPDQEAFVRQAIAAGRIQGEQEAVQQALLLWEARERARAEMLLAIDAADASLASGMGRIITQDSMRELAEDVKARGRARVAAARSDGR